MERIDSLQNSRIKEWTKLHQKKERDESGLFLVEGEHLILEALKADAVKNIVTDRSEPLFSFDHTIQTTPAVMKKLSQNVSAVHEIAVCRQQTAEIRSFNRLLLLDGIQDPGNMGTLIRTAKAFSFDSVYVSMDSCDLYNDKTIRSTQGALFHIPVIRTNLSDLVEQLQKEHITVTATTLDDAQPMSQIENEPAMAFILGNEGQGVSEKLQTMADRRLRIEMHGFESLNVAVAGGIIMYRYRNQK